MYTIKVTGIEKMEFTPKDSDRTIKGAYIHGLISQREVEGHAVKRVYIKEALIKAMYENGAKIGSEIKVLFNEHGKVGDVEIIKA
jgi:hypothetical protein